MNATSTRKQSALIRQWASLLVELKRDISDDYRCTDDPDDTTPGMLVTFGATVEAGEVTDWSYQTGDNSYSGGAYGHAYWGLCYLNRRSNSRELAESALDEIMLQAADNQP